MIARAGTWDLFTAGGAGFTLAAGVLGALGGPSASCSPLVNGGRPTVVPPLVFAGAPVVAVFVGMLYNPPENLPSPIFFLGIVIGRGRRRARARLPAQLIATAEAAGPVARGLLRSG